MRGGRRKKEGKGEKREKVRERAKRWEKENERKKEKKTDRKKERKKKKARKRKKKEKKVIFWVTQCCTEKVLEDQCFFDGLLLQLWLHLFYCIRFAWQGFVSGGVGCRGGFYKKLLETSVTFKGADASQLQDGPTGGQSWAHKQQW